MKNRRRGSRRRGGLQGRKILLIVTGGIAGYKSAFLVRLLKTHGADVRVVMTKAATEFVKPLTFETLSGYPVSHDLFSRRGEAGAEHVKLAVWADRVVVAPATADFLAKAGLGIADDLASAVLAAARCTVLFSPSMNEGMWENPAVQRNVGMLRKDGHVFIEPDVGELACGAVGPGRLAEPEVIAEVLEASFEAGDLEGVRFLVTAGRTEESIDPVRYVSNRSSGRMGFAIAAEAKRRGAHVTLVHGPVDVAPPEVDSVKRADSAARMKSAVERAFQRCDVLVMAAAVADYAPVRTVRAKIKRAKAGNLTIEFRPTTDILASLKGKKGKGQIVVGFALETSDETENALGKVGEKGCDYLVLNTVGKRTGFSAPTNQITLFKGKRRLLSTPIITKEEAASLIIDTIASDKRLRRVKR
ncbi:MAG: bifunctional phosphopantothenoylcysteine decarboxylase/phosphopantothenate--cysteine ligase CoaBC [Candidatus Krumholzibacteria bacterium]|nr:bifunctional phosphopantothenoylcysteine decarboxylase/phosphopantothenate--cysteine ligase CoaBC [Candidatus Krumholzibacteria bacterium]